VVQEIREATEAMARHLKVVGLMNVQYAVKEEDGRMNVYVLEVNPRASRTVPFVAKATGLPVAKIAAKLMAGMTLEELGIDRAPIPAHVSIKESVFPFRKFTGVDIVLGPEMRSTGEVMGISERFSIAFAKSQVSAGIVLPEVGDGVIFVSVTARHKDPMAGLAQRLVKLGYELIATAGTAQRLQEDGIEVTRVKKLVEGHPNLIDYMIDGKVKLVMNTPSGKGARTDEGKIRAKAVEYGVPCITTIQAAEAAVKAMEALREEGMEVQPLQERFSSNEDSSHASAETVS
jgi:carbamoyl-phosphate synthase large subunit